MEAGDDSFGRTGEARDGTGAGVPRGMGTKGHGGDALYASALSGDQVEIRSSGGALGGTRVMDSAASLNGVPQQGTQVVGASSSRGPMVFGLTGDAMKHGSAQSFETRLPEHTMHGLQYAGQSGLRRLSVGEEGMSGGTNQAGDVVGGQEDGSKANTHTVAGSLNGTATSAGNSSSGYGSAFGVPIPTSTSLLFDQGTNTVLQSTASEAGWNSGDGILMGQKHGIEDSSGSIQVMRTWNRRSSEEEYARERYHGLSVSAPTRSGDGGGHHETFGQNESRTVAVQGIDPMVSDAALSEYFECFGDIMALSSETKSQGYIVITYHDIRAARLALHTAHGTVWRGRQLACAMIGQQETGSSAAITLISLDGGRSLDDAYYLLSSFGELRDLRRDPIRKNCCVAEFFDSRHASTALASLSGSPDIAQRLLAFSGAFDNGNNIDVGAQPFSSQPDQNGFQSPGAYRAGVSDMSRNLSGISLDGGYSHQGQGLGIPTKANQFSNSADVLNTRNIQGYSSTGSIWPVNSLGSSPPAAWAQNSNVLAAFQAQQKANIQAQQLQAQNNVMQAAIHHALLNPAADGSFPYLNAEMLGALVRRHHSEGSLGGRLARRQMNPVAEAERKAQQDRLYGLDMTRILSGEDKRTTLMIKNIPNKYTQKMLLALLEERFSATYPFPFDFFYLPIDFKNKCNVGYAFINMTTHLAIPALVEDFHGKRWPKFNSEKVCQIAYGRIQGKMALVQHFQNSSLLHEDKRCRPVLFNPNGELEPFPVGPAALATFSMNLQEEKMKTQTGRSDTVE